jgi:hypothetical protein
MSSKPLSFTMSIAERSTLPASAIIKPALNQGLMTVPSAAELRVSGGDSLFMETLLVGLIL